MNSVAISTQTAWYNSLKGRIALLSLAGIVSSLTLWLFTIPYYRTPLIVSLVIGGIPLLLGLLRRVLQGRFGSDLLAGMAILTSIALGEYLAGVIIVLMLSGGEVLEEYALRKASSVLEALAKRTPKTARRHTPEGIEDVPLESLQINDQIEVLPHAICPVDGEVVNGRGSMDESFLTGEPYQLEKIPGSSVLSGALNGNSLLLIKATKLPEQSRYQQIAKVMEEQSRQQVPMQRLGDRLGAWYTPAALLCAIIGWSISGEPSRFLAVLVVATPCPLLIAIPVAVIGAISRAASRGIVIRNPVILERLPTCKALVIDKTGTLTYGTPDLVKTIPFNTLTESEALSIIASLEQYSRHPLAGAILNAARDALLELHEVENVSERPGEGLSGTINNVLYQVTHRRTFKGDKSLLPERTRGLECLLVRDGEIAALFQFQDRPRVESKAFISHLHRFHGISHIQILSGDRKEEVRALGESVGITDAVGELTPEQKLDRVKDWVHRVPTIYIGDGINDAPALQAATAGIALGASHDIAAEAADAVILEPSLEKVDELLHLARRMRSIALQSAIGGMTLSMIGIGAAVTGVLTPLAGAILQEAIDILAVTNALRVSTSERNTRHILKGD